MAKNIDSEFLESIDSMMKAGQSSRARAEFVQIRSTEVPRHLFRRYANLSGRLGAADKGLAVLKPVINSPTEIKLASSNEVMEYADLLCLVGAKNESLNLLRSLESNGLPKAYLYQAFIFMSEWAYYEAAAVLRKYLECNLNHYDRLIGELNLGISLGALLSLDKAELHLKRAISTATKTKKTLALGMAQGALGSTYAILGEDRLAIQHLERGGHALHSAHLRYRLYIERWQAFLMAKNGSDVAIERLREISSKANNLEIYEIARDNDLLIAIATNDESLAQRVYSGTPYKGYRERIMSLTDISPPSLSVRNEGTVRSTLDLRETSGKPKLNITRKMQMALRVLNSDFYRPLQKGEVFTKLFPDEIHYNPETSQNRVFNLICRLRSYFQNEGLPFNIVNQKFSYCLNVHKGGKIISNIDIKDKDKRIIQFETLKKKFRDNNFTRSQATEELEISTSQAQKTLQYLTKNNLIKPIGNGRSRSYKVITKMAS